LADEISKSINNLAELVGNTKRSIQTLSLKNEAELFSNMPYQSVIAARRRIAKSNEGQRNNFAERAY